MVFGALDRNWFVAFRSCTPVRLTTTDCCALAAPAAARPAAPAKIHRCMARTPGPARRPHQVPAYGEVLSISMSLRADRENARTFFQKRRPRTWSGARPPGSTAALRDSTHAYGHPAAYLSVSYTHLRAHETP